MKRLFAGLAAVLAFIPALAFATVLTVTASSVAWVSGPVTCEKQSGEAFVAGAALYYSASGTWLKAQGDGTATEAGVNGLAVALGTSDAAGAFVCVARAGAIVTLGTGAAGTVYIIGDTAGGIYPAADAGTADKVSIIGLGIGSNRLQIVEVYNAGSVVP